MTITPLTLREARRWVDLHHRRLRAPQGGQGSNIASSLYAG